jgi:hypothetical protein
MTRSVQIVISEGDKTLTAKRTVETHWPGREDPTFAELIGVVVEDVAKMMRERDIS